MKSSLWLRVGSLLILLISMVPASQAGAIAASAPPPVDMFQLPWDQGIAWYAIDGIDNGTKRPTSSSHNYLLGGAIDFAPHLNMVTGENTSNFWVTAAAAGTVVATSSCYITLSHANGWVTQYQFLANIQVRLGDTVARNQRIGIIADGVRYPYCAGYQEINVPHLHFMLRPSIIDASFAGWQVKYNSLFNSTSFTKNGTTLGLNRALMNTMDVVVPTATVPTQPTATPTSVMSPTPTLTGPYVSTTITPQTITVGGSALVTVRLNNVPSTGYNSTEFSCTYNANLFEASNVSVASLFGADPVVAINGPNAQNLIVAIAGSSGNKATTSGTAFTFDVEGLQPGQTVIECRARVSQGNNSLTEIPFVVDYLTIGGGTPTPVVTPSFTPTAVSPQPPSATPTSAGAFCDQAAFIADVNVPPGTQIFPGSQFTKTWRLQNIGSCDWTTAYQLVFFSGEQMSAPAFMQFNTAVDSGATVNISITLTAPTTPGSYRGNWMFRNANGQLFGIGPQASEPFFVDINVMSATPTPYPTFTPGGDWLTYTNSRYGFMFGYPGQLEPGHTDNFAQISLPYVQGTNLVDKFLEVSVVENFDVCESALQSQTAETVIISGLPFLVETGADAGAGNFYEWISFSTSRNSVCVTLDFVLHSLNPGSYATPVPEFDFDAESAVFGQIVSTYSWLPTTVTPSPASATPVTTATFTPSPTSSTPVTTATFTPSPAAATVTNDPAFTATPSGGNGAITGRAIASKPVTITVYDPNNTVVMTVQAQLDGSFHVEVPPGNYTVIASAEGYLRAQAAVPDLNPEITRILGTVTMAAGDIDGNNVIDQFDVLTIGMNYNLATPAAANLNNDSIINVLDLEALAKNYRKTGPTAWQ